MRTQVRVADPALWGPGHPALYDLRSTSPARRRGRAASACARSAERARSCCSTAGALVLHGASIQEDAPGHGDGLTGADMDAIVARLQRIHANATRAQHPLSPALLDRLDAAGILVWQEVGPVDSPGNWEAKHAAQARDRAPRASARRSTQLQTHPSILAWNLGNEVAGPGPLRRPGGVHRRHGARAAPHRPRPAGRARHLGHARAARARADVPPHRRARPDELHRLVRPHVRVAGADRAASSAPTSPRCGACSPTARSSCRSSARRPTAATRAGGRAATASRRACSRRTCAPTRRSRGSAASWSGC